LHPLAEPVRLGYELHDLSTPVIFLDLNQVIDYACCDAELPTVHWRHTIGINPVTQVSFPVPGWTIQIHPRNLSLNEADGRIIRDHHSLVGRSVEALERAFPERAPESRVARDALLQQLHHTQFAELADCIATPWAGDKLTKGLERVAHHLAGLECHFKAVRNLQIGQN